MSTRHEGQQWSTRVSQGEVQLSACSKRTCEVATEGEVSVKVFEAGLNIE